jgi:hypothetical protein
VLANFKGILKAVKLVSPEQLAGATRREMRQLVDECLCEFSDRVENMFANFENGLGANGSTHFLGRGLENTPRIVFDSKCVTIPPLQPNATSAPLVLELDTQRERAGKILKGFLRR